MWRHGLESSFSWLSWGWTRGGNWIPECVHFPIIIFGIHIQYAGWCAFTVPTCSDHSQQAFATHDEFVISYCLFNILQDSMCCIQLAHLVRCPWVLSLLIFTAGSIATQWKRWLVISLLHELKEVPHLPYDNQPSYSFRNVTPQCQWLFASSQDCPFLEARLALPWWVQLED